MSVKIKGVSHEFSAIPNVMEDTIQIILNLKQVRFKVHGEGVFTVSLKVKGEKEINASMIECPSQVELVNKDAHIATITSSKGELDIEMEVGSGIGYVAVEQQEREKKEVGTIAVDAIYTPIRRVNYTIDNMRVGKKTDYEKITLEISTDGSISPKEAFIKAVEILESQFAVLTKINEGEKEVKKGKKEEIVEEEVEEKKEKEDPGEIEVASLKNLSTRTLNVLEKNKVAKVKDIAKLSEEKLADLEGMGDKGVKEIKKAIGDFGIILKKSE
jgi:DNA-directed RNA polymerase subunit alpha